MKTAGYASIEHIGKAGQPLFITDRLLAIACGLAIALLFSSSPARALQPAWPVHLPIQDFGAFGDDNDQEAHQMSAEEEQAFETSVSTMESFPPYFYSGCHDRAHAAYLLLPQDLRSKVRKIWVVTPARYTAAIGGTIGLRGASAAASAVSWGYHVALGIDTESGMRVYDPALHPGGTITREAWFGMMTIPRLAFWTATKGSLYLFNYSEVQGASPNGREIWNGNANYYHLYAQGERIMPDNLARDSVGVKATAGETCAQIIALATNPQGLLTFLHAAETAPPECRASIELFQGERERWRRLLH